MSKELLKENDEKVLINRINWVKVYKGREVGRYYIVFSTYVCLTFIINSS